ncbi:uncharacterized protein LOC127395181 isoform X3 [Apus apus]|uniref:uncharacterized protein LOC127395181 isoform X3 n=1 Tax=Apus apus TaxID=8895 RepID=UPI0021F8BA03|nr:uncharacterized protein LOC127395181 isoform X3 [Apus apus]
MLLDSVKKAGRRGGEKPAETKSLPWRFRPQYPADGPRSAEERPVTDGGPATGGRGAPRTTVQEGISLKRFRQFCLTWGIQHVHGIPHSPTGQAMVERAHQTLKNLLIKQKAGEPSTSSESSDGRNPSDSNGQRFC